MPNSVFCSIIAVAFVAYSPVAQAQDANILNTKLGESKICEPLKFDLKDVAKALGVSIPDIPGDTNIGWDKDHHVVQPDTFKVDPSRKMTAKLTIDCRPSPDGEVMKLSGKSPQDVRLTENADCTATVGTAGEVADLNCALSGAVGDFLGKITGLNDKLKPAFQAALAGV